MNVSFETLTRVFNLPTEIAQDGKEEPKSNIQSLVNCLLPLGGAFGAFSASLILSVLRRKNALMFTDLIGIIGVIIGLVMKNLYNLCCSRFIIGLAIGFNSALVPLYIKEYSPL